MKSLRTPIKIIVVDDHELLRKGCINMLSNHADFTVINEAMNGKELLEQIKIEAPDVVLMDISMPVLNGIEATKFITQLYPEISVIILSAFHTEYQIAETLIAGAKGYVLKASPLSELEKAIKTVHRQEVYYCENVRTQLLSMAAVKVFNPVNNHYTTHLTTREKQVLELICMQKTNRDISEFLKLSIRSVEDIRSRLLEKTNVQNTAGLVVFAIKNGIYKIDN